MATCIFHVDVSTESGDFQAMATEPGLAMLDRPGANFEIMRHWLGDLVAEPEWHGEDMVGFFVQDQERGRLENVECHPATKADLQGVLKKDLEELTTRIKKIKPESSTEELLYRIARKTFSDLTKDLDHSDFDCFFFKCRPRHEPWRLVWCWGYQRSDLQPAPAIICTNQDCTQLFVRRKKRGRPRCPACEKAVLRPKKAGVLGKLQDNLVPLLLLLLLLLGVLGYFGWPRLIVTPGRWEGPPGARVAFDVQYKRWFFFNDDVSDVAVPQSHDTRKIVFDGYGATARAKAMGRTLVSFYHEGRSATVPVVIGPPHPPDSISIVPEKVPKMGIGSTVQLKAMGHYKKGEPVDVTDLVEWKVADGAIVDLHRARLEGVAAGKTKVTAGYPGKKSLTASVDVQVFKVDYKELHVAVEPSTLAIDQSGRIDVFATDKDGAKYSFLGSSCMELEVVPASSAEIKGDYVVGRAEGRAKLEAAMHAPAGKLTASFPFTVGGESLLAGLFVVRPEELRLAVDEYYELDVKTASDAPVEITSSDTEVVEAIGEKELAGRSPGKAVVTVTQGDQQREVAVTVTESTTKGLAIVPPEFHLRVGEETPFAVVGKTADGRTIGLAPDELVWEKQPLSEYVFLDRNEFLLRGIRPTGEPQTMRVRFGDKVAEATIEVTGGGLAADLAVGGQFGAYPPVPVSGRYLTDLGNPVFGGTRLEMLPDGSGIRVVGPVDPASPLAQAGVLTDDVIVGLDGARLAGLSPARIRELLGGVGEGGGFDILRDGELVPKVTLPRFGGIFGVQATAFRPSNVTASSFDGQFDLQLREAAEYRIVDAAGNPLSEWANYDARSTVTIPVTGIPRTATDEYELYVERNMDGRIRKFPIPFDLASETP